MTLLVIRVPGEIRGKGRHKSRVLAAGVHPETGKPKFRVQTYTPARTQAAENDVAWCAIQQVGQPMLEGPLSLHVVITVTVPRSWSKKKQAEALAGTVFPTGKPDFDNTSKLICDALNKIVWRDDSQIVDARVTKRYGEKPGAVLEIGRPGAA